MVNGMEREGYKVFRAPAKINLVLRVLGKRPDGFHEIFSVMQPVSLYDEIRVNVRPGDSLAVETDSVDAPGGEKNLAYRAAALFLEVTGKKADISIRISKKIPVGAGLGGGSSDGATVLMALNDIMSAGLPMERLMEMGAGLGSDVPFFLLKGAAIARGRGEVLTPVDLPGYDYVLLNPGFPVSTAWVYGNLNLTKASENNNLTYSVETLRDAGGLGKSLVNDLERVTGEKYTEIGSLKAALIEEGALSALMSGSGPTVFGLFRNAESATRAFDRLGRRLGPGVKRFLVHGVQG